MKKIIKFIMLSVAMHGCVTTERQTITLDDAPQHVESNLETVTETPIKESKYQKHNGSVPYEQASAICNPRADLARMQAASNYQAPDPSYSEQCRPDLLGGYKCSSTRVSGGFAGGFAAGLESGMVKKQAYKMALDSCMAEFGWF
jgi:hypothetical protein